MPNLPLAGIDERHANRFLDAVHDAVLHMARNHRVAIEADHARGVQQAFTKLQPRVAHVGHAQHARAQAMRRRLEAQPCPRARLEKERAHHTPGERVPEDIGRVPQMIDGRKQVFDFASGKILDGNKVLHAIPLEQLVLKCGSLAYNLPSDLANLGIQFVRSMFFALCPPPIIFVFTHS